MSTNSNLGRESKMLHMPGYKPSYHRRLGLFPQPVENKWHRPFALTTNGLGGGGYKTTKRYDYSQD